MNHIGAIMNQFNQLSLEQEFNVRAFADQVQQMSRQESQQFLLMLYEQMIIKETIYKELLKSQWELN
jgi:hypothetical protein